MEVLHCCLKENHRKIPYYFVEQDIWQELLSFLLNEFSNHAIFLITDANIYHLYGKIAKKSLNVHKGFQEIVTFPGSEISKSREAKCKIEDILLQKKAGRDTVILAMGGGVTGDLAGYVTATLHRGIPLIHIPTSLIAQVDSSIGGKVGINHSSGKNLLGAFYQPQSIWGDVKFLQTLPLDEFKNGMAEVIKYAVILDSELWEWLEKDIEKILQRDLSVLKKLVLRCAQLKIKVVEADEKENGYRSILNFGHTVGHALEQLSGYRVKHGFAITAGMKIAAQLSQQLLGYPVEKVEKLSRLFRHYDLDRINLSSFAMNDVWNCMMNDKKARQHLPRFTLMESFTKPSLFYLVEKRIFEDVFKQS